MGNAPCPFGLAPCPSKNTKTLNSIAYLIFLVEKHIFHEYLRPSALKITIMPLKECKWLKRAKWNTLWTKKACSRALVVHFCAYRTLMLIVCTLPFPKLSSTTGVWKVVFFPNFSWLLLISKLGCNEHIHNLLDELQFQLDWTTDSGVYSSTILAALEQLKSPYKCIMALRCAIVALWGKCVFFLPFFKARKISKFSQIHKLTAELGTVKCLKKKQPKNIVL